MATAVAEGFRWQTTAAGRVLQCEALLEFAPHVFTTRELSFRAESSAHDRARVERALEIAEGALATVSQVHGRTVVTLTSDRRDTAQQEADAIVSVDGARAVAVRVADCVPILVAHRSAAPRVIAAIHAGWRGTASNVTRAAIEEIVDAGIPANELIAAIGPSIGPCCYQVDDRVRLAFLAMTPDAAAWFSEDSPGKWKLDLWQANADQLADAGVPTASIHPARHCTAEHLDDCYSYRKEGAGTGRLMAAIAFRTGG